MYYLVMYAIFHASTGQISEGYYRWPMPDKATCEMKRDALLALHNPIGKLSGPTDNPYLTDAWCLSPAEGLK